MITLLLSSREGSWGLKSCIKVYLCIGSKSAKIPLHVEIEFNVLQSCSSESWVSVSWYKRCLTYCFAQLNPISLKQNFQVFKSFFNAGLDQNFYLFILYFIENVRKFYYDNKFNKFWLDLTSTNVFQPYSIHTLWYGFANIEF